MSCAAFASASKKAGEAKTSAPPGGLRIGAADDAHEREADRIADAAMSGGSVGWSLATLPVEAPLRRKSDGGGQAAGECEACRSDENLRRKPHGSRGPQIAPVSVDATLRAAGRPMEPATRSFFETRFGVDFGRVRIHADDSAARSAREVNAVAYTVGDHVVLGAGAQAAPRDHAGQRLLAHELAHTLQRAPGRVARQVGSHDKRRKRDMPNVLARPHVPVAPSTGLTDVPRGVTPCLVGLMCRPPVKGSAWDFGKRSEKESAPPPKTPKPATETKKAAETLRPGVLNNFVQAVIHPGLFGDVGAYGDSCKNVHVKTADKSARCMGVPEHLENEAALFNKGRHCLDPKVSSDKEGCQNPFLDRDIWTEFFLSTMVHESAHVDFGKHRPAEISAATSNEITLHELSEMYAQFSEFPVHVEMIQKNPYIDPKEAQGVIETSYDAWVQLHVEQDGEGIRGMLTKLRCINTCEKVKTLILALMRAVTAKWPAEIRDALLRRLVNTPGLNWPQAEQPLRRPEPERPKFPPLYRPRTGFEPEIGTSTERLR